MLTAVVSAVVLQRMRVANAELAGTVRAEQDMSAAVLRAVGALVAILDPEGRIVYFNRACEEVSGYGADEVLGRSLTSVLVPPEDAPAIRTGLAGVVASDLPITDDAEWLTKDGRRRSIQWSTTALTDAEGQITHLIGTGLDVTEHRGAERAVAESRARLATFFENAPAILYWKDPDGRFVAVSKVFTRLFGYTDADVAGRPLEDLFPAPLAEAIHATDGRVRETRAPIEYESTIDSPSGDRRFQNVKFPLWAPEGRLEGIGGISIDITDLVQARKEVEHARRETVARLGRAVEYRDEDTGAHIERMSSYCELIARGLGLDERRCQDIHMASAMHDAGKIAVPDSVLLKQGPLTDAERAIMQSHAEVGWDLLCGSSSRVLELAAVIARTHHERFDGNGYPRGLAGADIPLEGRIAAVADVFDALTCSRVYRPAFSVEEAVEMMCAERGAHFDPRLLDLFLERLELALAIRARPSLREALPRLPSGVGRPAA